MPRIPREFLIHKGVSFHKIWRGHNKEWNLAADFEKQAYLSFLNKTFPKDSTRLSAVCLMSNHVHEIYKTLETRGFSNFMRRHHMRYGLFFNQRHERCGKVAHDRPKTCSIENDAEEMKTTFYIHSNPLRAKMVKDARNHPWSTHILFAFGKRTSWMKHVSFPEWYFKLGRTWKERQRKYRQFFQRYLEEEGMAKRSFSSYGSGSMLWIHERRREILKQMKERYGPSG